ncbi:hypothetical protein [Nitrosomonas sp.]|uniref:hypothetical protein n=1 Tax=Nitrosomonas sp. TaxID=42353 RepID=UPI00261DE82A|nr:hypothetical protein [Nitrosomonas sp.]
MIRHTLMLLALGMLLLLVACASKTQEKKPADSATGSKIATPFEQLSLKSSGKTVFEDAGKFILIEGSKCMQRENGAEVATILQWIEMPGYVDSGTVVLNGWDLRYLQSEQEVNSMRADITHSKLVRNTGSAMLMFEVQGKLDDQNRNDAYEFCVFYSAFGYHSAWFDATVEGDYSGIDTSTLQNKNQGAVATLENTGSKGTLKGNDAIAIMPRGFDFQFDDTFECELRFPPCKWADRADYRLLQAAYSLSQTGISPNSDGSPHWVTQTIFKDNTIRTHRIKTRTALIRGSSVKLRPDFLALNPRTANTGNCRKNADGIVRTQTFRINDLPYDYAVPMLTGWDLSYECENQLVQRAGIWIHDIRFDPNASSMEYKVSSILRDQDGAPSFNAAHRITVLGLNRILPPAQRRAPEINIKIRGN